MCLGLSTGSRMGDLNSDLIVNRGATMLCLIDWPPSDPYADFPVSIDLSQYELAM